MKTSSPHPISRWQRSLSLALPVLMALLGALAFPSPAFACSCVEPPPPLEALNQSGAVFSGRVIAIQRVPGLPSQSEANYVSFQVQRVWKGNLVGEIRVTTQSSSAACGYPFERNKDYLVYAYGSLTDLQVSLCSRTQSLAEASQDLQALGAGQPPPQPAEDASSAPKVTVILVCGGTLLGLNILAGVALWRYFGRPPQLR